MITTLVVLAIIFVIPWLVLRWRRKVWSRRLKSYTWLMENDPRATYEWTWKLYYIDPQSGAQSWVAGDRHEFAWYARYRARAAARHMWRAAGATDPTKPNTF